MANCMECEKELKEHEIAQGLCAKCNNALNGTRGMNND